ncbi:hypothetical protein [Longispora urticae]
MNADAERAEPDPDDVDAQFARIVAGYHTDAPDRPEIESVELTDMTALAGLSPRGPEPDEPGLLEGLDTFGMDLEGDEDEHYVPPPPPPLPRPTKRVVTAALVFSVGTLLLFWPELLPISDQLVRFAGMGGIVAAVVMLVMLLKPGDEEDYDPDQGARV